jgi:hypothetical protein
MDNTYARSYIGAPFKRHPILRRAVMADRLVRDLFKGGIVPLARDLPFDRDEGDK